MITLKQFKDHVLVQLGFQCHFCDCTLEDGCYNVGELVDKPEWVLGRHEETAREYTILEITEEYLKPVKLRNLFKKHPERLEMDGWIVGKQYICCNKCLQEELDQGAKIVD